MRNLTAMSQQENGCVDFHGILALKASAAILHGAGTSSAPFQKDTADKNFLSYYLKSAATSGTGRGLYMRLYLSGGAGGEAIRAFTTVESNTPADTVNGIHASLNFGASAGNITGLGTAARCTLHVPNRALNGTTGAIMAELYADGSSSSNGGTMSLFRGVLDGDGTGLAAVEDTANLIHLQGGSNASGNIVSAAGNEPTWTSATHKIRVNMNGTTMYLVAVLA